MHKHFGSAIIATTIAFFGLSACFAQQAGVGVQNNDPVQNADMGPSPVQTPFNVSNDTGNGQGDFATGGYTGGSTGGGIFSIPNFEGDSRNSDMYVFMHPSGHPQWDDYRRLVQQIADQSIGAVPQPHFPEFGSNAGYENAAALGVGGSADGENANGGTGGNGNFTSGGPTGGNTGMTGGGTTGGGTPGVTTSVTGVVTNPPSMAGQPVPGLVSQQ